MTIDDFAIKRARLLLVDDDSLITTSLCFLLRQEGFRVMTAGTAAEAFALVKAERPDLILLDIGLPDLGGIELCRRIRQLSSAPIIYLTARRDEADMIVALDAGGDDYVTKPCSVGELFARIRARLRRADNLAAAEPIAAGDLVVDRATHQVTVANEPVSLTPREFDLLTALAQQAGRVVRRQSLLDTVWGVDYFVDDKVLDVYIRQIRRKIESHPDRPVRIQTIRGVGYRLNAVTGDRASLHPR